MRRLTDRESRNPTYAGQGGLCVSAEFVRRLAAYEDTGISPQDLQEVVDRFSEVIKRGNTTAPVELKSWMERCTWHVQKCSELRSELDRLEIENENYRRVYGDALDQLNDTEYKLEKAEQLISLMKADLLLAASGHCCGLCAKKPECADVAQVTCCSAFQYYKAEEKKHENR